MAAAGDQKPEVEGVGHGKLVLPLLDSMASTLPCNTQASDILDTRLLESNRACLIAISQTCMAHVATPLAELLQITTAKSKEPEAAEKRLAFTRSQIILFDTLSTCFEKQHDAKADDEERLEGNVVLYISKEALQVISGGADTDAELLASAGRLVFHLTSLNFEPVYEAIVARCAKLATGGEDASDLGELLLLPHVHFTQARLARLVDDCATQSRPMKKNVQLELAGFLAAVIAKWLQVHPLEFLRLQQDGGTVTESCPSLFETFFTLSDKGSHNARKQIIWPFLMRLLLLSPQMMSEIVVAKDAASLEAKYQAPFKLLEAIKKSLFSSKQLSPLAVRLFVEFCSTASIVPKNSLKSGIIPLAIPIEQKLRLKILDPAKPYFDGSEAPDEDTMVSLLTSTYRLDNHYAVFQLLSPFLTSPEAPTLFRVVVMRTLVAVTEQHPDIAALDWTPGIKKTLPLLPRAVRRLFQNLIHKIRNTHTGTSSTRLLTGKQQRKDSKVALDASQDMSLLRWIIRLFCAEPQFAFHHNDGEADSDPSDQKWYPPALESTDIVMFDTKKVMTGLTLCFQEKRFAELSEIAQQTLLRLNEPRYVRQWNPANVMPSFWEISSNVFLSLSIQLIGLALNEDTARVLLLLKQLLSQRNEFLLSHRASSAHGSGTDLHKQTRNKLEVVFLSYLCSSQPEVVDGSARCLALLCNEADVLLDVVTEEAAVQSLQANLSVYRQISGTTRSIMGQKALKKKIYSLLRCIEVQTGGNLGAWDGLFAKWSSIMDPYMRPQAAGEAVLEAPPAEWDDITGFLCALGGVCLMSDLAASRLVSYETFGDTSAPLPAPVRNLQRFLVKVVSLLTCQIDEHGVSIRETVRTLLGQELAPPLYPMVLEQLSSIVAGYFEKDRNNVQISPVHTLFTDQAIKLVRKLMESRLDKAADYLALADMEPLVMGFVDYLRKLELDEESQKTKIGFCHLVSSMIEMRDHLTFRHEMHFRNALVHKLMEFMSTGNQAVTSQHQAELDSACMKAVAKLLAELPLQPLYEDDNSDQKSAKSKLFLQDFTFFMNVTNRCKSSRPGRPDSTDASAVPSFPGARNSVHLDGKDKDKPSLSRPGSSDVLSSMRRMSVRKQDSRHGTISRRAASSQALLEKQGSAAFQPSAAYHRQRTDRYLASLREASCQAMSHLLSANVEVGLGHSISMGYHEDVGVRLAFTEVLTKVLQQGTEFDNLAETVRSDRCAKLVRMVISPDLFVVHALANVLPSGEIDDFVQLLVSVFEAHGLLLPFFFRAAEWEVQQCKTAQTLFRRNSLVTKLATTCARTYGHDALRAALEPVIQGVISGGQSYEIDEKRARDGEDLAANRARLAALCKETLQRITQALAGINQPFRLLCAGIRKATGAQYPDASISAVGGLVFLRFVTPAIVAPKANAIISSHVPGPAQRALLLVSKVLQNTANQAEFTGVKEPFMASMNDVVKECIPVVVAALEEASGMPSAAALDPALVANFGRFGISIPGAAPTPPAADAGAASAGVVDGGAAGGAAAAAEPEEQFALKEHDFSRLHHAVFNNLEKLSMSTARGPSARIEPASSTPYQTFDRLARLLAELGEPRKLEFISEGRRRSDSLSVNATNENKFEEFLRRHRRLNTSTTEIQSKNIFYKSGVSAARHPLYYFVARRYDVNTLDADQLLYFVLSELKGSLTTKFELVLDLTMFGRENEPTAGMLEKLVSVLPPGGNSLLVAVYVYNAPSWFRGLAKRCQRLVFGSKLNKRLKFVTFAELQAHVPKPELPPLTVRLSESTQEFGSVVRLGPSRRTAPVTVKVGAAAVQVVSNERVKIFNIPTHTVDVFAVARISELRLGPEDNLMRVMYDGGAEELTLLSPDVGTLFRAVEDIWERHRLSEPSGRPQEQKVIRPSDVPGTLLNMALLNLGAPDPALRLASYNLLAALTTTFSFNIEGELLEAQGLAIPENNSNFIIRISECLAVNEARLTLEFLRECISGLGNSTPEQKHLCLEYMQPWLPNVKTFASGSPERTVAIIRGLVDATLAERALYPSLQAKVWYTIARVEDLVESAVDHFLTTALDAGPGSAAATILPDACVTLASANVRVVARRVLDRLLLVLEKTSKQPTRDLPSHTLWPDLLVLVRFLLMLSFNDRLDLARNLPDVLHIITMVVACGPSLVRASVHATFLNLVQSLCTSLALEEDSVRLLRTRLDDLIQPKVFVQFGLYGASSVSRDLLFSAGGAAASVGSVGSGGGGGHGGGHGASGASSDPAAGTAGAGAPLKPQALKVIVETMSEVVAICGPKYAGPWRERWYELTEAASFTDNAALQPRAFVALGVITSDIPAELIPRTMRSLDLHLRRFDLPIVDSLTTCLASLTRKLPPESYFHSALFWVAMSLLQAGEHELFASALAMVEASLSMLEQRGAFDEQGLEAVLMADRAPVEETYAKLEALCGLGFARKKTFSFAVAGSLLKGLNHGNASTIAQTVRVLVAFVNAERRATKQELTSDLVGYVAALLPTVEEIRDSVRPGAGRGGEDGGGLGAGPGLPGVGSGSGSSTDAPPSPSSPGGAGGFGRLLGLDVLDNELTTVLLLVLACARLETTKHSREKRILLELLAEAAQSFAYFFPIVEKQLLPCVSAIIAQRQDRAMVQSCQALLLTLARRSGSGAQTTLIDSFLEENGFKSLPTAGKFTTDATDAERRSLAHLSAHILQTYTSLGAQAEGVSLEALGQRTTTLSLANAAISATEA